jgi:hypothetical protein
LTSQDILILTETFITEHIDLPGYYAAHSYAVQKQEGRPSGGVSCLYKPNIGQKISTKKEESIVIVTTDIVTIIGIYIKPQTTVEDTIETIMNIGQIDPQETTILAADLNCRIDKPNINSKMVLSLMEEEGFKLINNKELITYVTCNGRSVIDLVF